MTTDYKLIPLEDLEHNTGQIDGVPKNPRQWTQDDLGKLVKSIRETPELLQARGLIVVPNGDKMVVVGGNMRLSALIKLRYKQAPCIVLNGLSTEKICEIVIKDNSSFGQWDAGELKLNWGDIDLQGWGVDTGFVDMKICDIERNQANDESRTIEFTFEPDDYYAVVGVLRGYSDDNAIALKMALDLL